MNDLIANLSVRLDALEQQASEQYGTPSFIQHLILRVDALEKNTGSDALVNFLGSLSQACKPKQPPSEKDNPMLVHHCDICGKDLSNEPEEVAIKITRTDGAEQYLYGGFIEHGPMNKQNRDLCHECSRGLATQYYNLRDEG